MRKLIILLSGVLSASCDSRSVPPFAGAAVVQPAPARLNFTRVLLATINRSDKIMFTEHSSRGDFIDGGEVLTAPYHRIIYEMRELTIIQKAVFILAVDEMDMTVREGTSTEINLFGPTKAEAPCVFSPHHTIAFLSRGRVHSTMEVSFACGRVEWAADKPDAPKALASMLYKFVRFIGLQPDRDWERLAKENAAKVEPPHGSKTEERRQ